MPGPVHGRALGFKAVRIWPLLESEGLAQPSKKQYKLTGYPPKVQVAKSVLGGWTSRVTDRVSIEIIAFNSMSGRDAYVDMKIV